MCGLENMYSRHYQALIKFFMPLTEVVYLLKDVLDKNGLMNASHQIYNVDENGVPLDPKALNVVAKKCSKKVQVRSTGK